VIGFGEYMNDRAMREMALLVEEGIVTGFERSWLRARSDTRESSPLSLARQKGLISEETLFELRRRAEPVKREEDTLDRQLDEISLLSEDTLEQEPAPPPVDGFPVQGWPRYTYVRRLGRGGMSQVFLAWDPQLERHVALKFLHEDLPFQVDRFIREARAQARVDHEHICKIYEVGEVQGRPFIAMQHIDGHTLGELIDEMTVEQKLSVISQVARGLHKAHRAGLIHRDIKPGNIMVTRNDEGEHKAFLLDFGLARFDETTSDLTVAGSLLGTPAFMSPEQARGNHDQLDRRTDVYSLGATLYQVLTGQAPFAATSWGPLMSQILDEEPVIPKTLAEDLRTILGKCLEKRAEERYDSARALAEDLDRFLEGEPILARPVSLVYRLRKKLRKNRLLVRVVGVASLLLIFSIGWSIRTSIRAGAREELARELTREVGEIEARMRTVYLAPAHDIRDDLDNLRTRLTEMALTVARAGAIARGSGSYALGLGHFTLGEVATGLDHLESAWAEGFREPRVAYALCLAYSSIYREELARLNLIADETTRERRRREVEARFRERTLSFIRRAEGYQAAHPRYLPALLAYIEERFDEALTLLAMNQSQLIWFFEAPMLEADIYREQANRAFFEGRTEAARAHFERALKTYDEAAQIARSNPEIYENLALTRLQMFSKEQYSSPDFEAWALESLELTERALTLHPDRAETWLLKATIHRRTADFLHYAERDPRPQIERAQEAAGMAESLGADPSRVHLELGRTAWTHAKWLEDYRRDNRSVIADAREALDRVSEDDRDYAYYQTLGQLHVEIGKAKKRKGEPACEDYDRAVEAYRKTISLEPDLVYGYNSMVIAFLGRSGLRDCGDADPMALLEEAGGYLERAIARNDSHWVLYYNAGRILFARAQHGDRSLGLLDDALAEQALAAYRRARSFSPKIMHHIDNVMASIHMARARRAWDSGGDPVPHFEAAEAAYRSALASASRSRIFLQNMAWYAFYRFKHAVRTGIDPEDWFEETARWNARARAVSASEGPELLLCEASVYRIEAERSFLAGKDPRSALREAERRLDRLLQINEEHVEAHRSSARLYTLWAEYDRRRGAIADPRLDRARAHLDTAIERADVPAAHTADAKWYYAAAAATEKGRRAPLASKGLAAVARALDIDPKLREAKELRDALEDLSATPAAEIPIFERVAVDARHRLRVE